MDISVNISYLRKRRGTTELRPDTESAVILKEAGYNSIDFSPGMYIKEDGWERKIEKLKGEFDKIGITTHQTHAPYVFDTLPEDVYAEHMRRAFVASKMMGSEYIVIHADKYIPDENGFDFNKALLANYDFYAPYVEYAKKNGLGVAIENLFEPRDCKERFRFTSRVEEQLAIIEKFNDSTVTACWDIGHGKVANYDEHINEIAKLGSLITCTHIHDNIYGIDQHAPLYHGDCDWEGVVKHFRSIGYKGKFTYELVYGTLPDELLPRYMKLYFDTGAYLLSSVK